MAIVEVLNFKIGSDSSRYQTVRFNDEKLGEYETHIRTSEDLKEVCDSEVVTDFRIVDDLLMASPSLDGVDVCAKPHVYKFEKSLVDLLYWMVENGAIVLLEDGTEIRALSMRVSSSTMTIYASYQKDGSWKSFKFMHVSELGLVGNEFNFVVPVEVPKCFGLKKGIEVTQDGKTQWRYEYRNELLVAPMATDHYLLPKAMLHYLAVRADLFYRVKELLKVLEKRAFALTGIVDASVPQEETRTISHVPKSGVSIKRHGSKTPNYALVFDEYFKRYMQQKEVWTLETVKADVLQNTLVPWERTAKLLVTTMFFRYTQPEDRIQYVSNMIKLLAERELAARLAIYQHRAFIYVNDISFYVTELDYRDRAYLTGGTSKDYYILTKE